MKSKSTRRTTTATPCRQAHRSAHDRDGRHVGNSHAAGRAEERRAELAAKTEALQRQNVAWLHRRQHQGAARTDHQRRHAGHFAPLCARQNLECLGGASRGPFDQPVHGAQRARSRTKAPHLDHQRRAAHALSRAVGRGQGGVRKHREKRSPTCHRRRRRRAQAAMRQLHRQRQGLHAAPKR